MAYRPRCKGNGVEGSTINYVTTVVHCVLCGLTHVPGSSRESFDRQMKGYDPLPVQKRVQALRTERV